MKIYRIIVVLLLSVAASEAVSYTPSKIEGAKGSLTGKTSNDKVTCLLRLNAKGLHKGGSYVEGTLRIETDYLTSGVSMEIYKSKVFELISSVSLKGSVKGKMTEYNFSINKELIGSTHITVFTSVGMYRLDLKSMAVLPAEKG